MKRGRMIIVLFIPFFFLLLFYSCGWVEIVHRDGVLGKGLEERNIRIDTKTPPPSPNENGSRKRKWSLMKRRPSRDDDDVNHHPRTKSRPDCIKTAGSKYPEIRMRFYFNILIFCLASRNESRRAKKLCSPYIYSSLQSTRHSSFGYEWTGNSLYSPLSTPEIKFAFEAFVLELLHGS